MLYVSDETIDRWIKDHLDVFRKAFRYRSNDGKILSVFGQKT